METLDSDQQFKSSETPINSSKYSNWDIEKFINETNFLEERTQFINFLARDLLGEDYYAKGHELKEPSVRPEIIKKIVELINGQTLVDLGCGDSTFNADAYKNSPEINYPTAIRIAKRFGAKKYVGIDPYAFPYYDLEKNHREEGLRKIAKSGSEACGIEIEFVELDMLKYLHDQPDNSNCYLISGIDNNIIVFPYLTPEGTPTYITALIDELYRTTSKPGVVIVNDSNILKPELMQSAGFKMAPKSKESRGLSIWFKE